MTDNVTLPLTGSGDATAVAATESIAGKHHQKIRLNVGAAGVDSSLTLGVAAGAASVPVVIASDQSAVPVSLASVPSHAVTGSGNFASTVADGADVTLGAKADAKNSATDTTPISAMSVLKQISASVQAPPSQAVTNTGTFAVQAAQSGTWNVGALTTLTTIASQGKGVAVSLTRTNDTNAYLANDVIGAATGSTAALTFANAGAAAGEHIITSASLEIDAAAVIAGETSYRLYLYSVTPPSATGDNGAWDLPSGDRASFLGYIDLGTPVDLGSTLFVQVDGINKQLTLASTSLFAYLVTIGAYTPTASRVYVVTLHTVPA